MATTKIQPQKKPTKWASAIPILSWLPRHDRSWLRFDIIAGLTLWGMVGILGGEMPASGGPAAETGADFYIGRSQT